MNRYFKGAVYALCYGASHSRVLDELRDLVFEKRLLSADKGAFLAYANFKITGIADYTNVQRDIISTVKRNLTKGH